MSLPSDLVSRFVKIVNSKEQIKKESTQYGTIKETSEGKFVQLDGSDILTPMITTVDVNEGDRVTVLLKNHTATVTGNVTYPSAKQQTVTDVSKEINEAKTAASLAETAADEAKTAASLAQTEAGKAKTTAGEAKTTASNALTTANNASQTAGEAKTTANEAKTTAGEAKTTADEAKTTATAAEGKATSAELKATTAQTTASLAQTMASNAQTVADEAKTTATAAEGKATSAELKATTAQTTASLAQTMASNAQSTMGTSGIWTYRKWSNGQVELWGTRIISNVACTSSLGGMYRTAAINGSEFPFSIANPVVLASYESAGYGAMLWATSVSSSSSTPSYYLIRPTSATITSGQIHFYVRGTYS